MRHLAVGAKPIDCPCCGQQVKAPALAILCDHYELTPRERAILGAVWAGNGLPIHTERIFDAMYADDANGGPAQSQMYLAFKVALSRLRVRLQGSGVAIQHAGRRRGYRLILGDRT